MKRSVACGVALLSLAVALPAAAQDVSFLDESVQALQARKVYVSALATEVDAGAAQRLTERIGDADIAIAVLPEAAAGETDGDVFAFATEIAEATGHTTVAVAIGRDLEAGSEVLQPGLAREYANDAENGGGSVEDALSDFIAKVKAAGPEPDPEQGDGSDASSVLWVVVLVVALGVVGLLAGLAVSRRRRGEQEVRLEQSPDPVKDGLNAIRSLQPRISDAELQALLTQIRRDVEEYFRRSRQRNLDTAEEAEAFERHLKSLREIMDNYVDIQDSPPRYYPDRDELMRNRKEAAEGFAQLVVELIQRNNNRALLDYDVKADILRAEKFR